MEDKNKFIICISMIACLLIGGMLGRSSPITTTSTNDVTINQQVPENFEKNSKNSEIFEKKSKKININTATLRDFKDGKVGIGEVKYKELVKYRPYKDTSELIEKGVIGYYTYTKHKDRFTVGD